MKVKDYLKDCNAEQYHIFDSHQEAMDERGVNHNDQDYIIYNYNTHKNNKPKEGDVFIYRRPGKTSKTRLFQIYGGGQIERIEKVDNNGNVNAVITKPFKLEEPLVQNESESLENFEWTSKQKNPGTWAHFWNQYGMNQINKGDFFGLVGDLDCSIPSQYNAFSPTKQELSEEFAETVTDANPTGFNIHFEESGKNSPSITNSNKVSLTGRHVDFIYANKRNTDLGKAGEVLVFEYLKETLDPTVYQIEHTSVFRGDGFGYDIKLTCNDGTESFIEVKTTRSPYVDGFYISPRELNASRRLDNYQIYRVYNFDEEKKTADIKVYNAPFKDEDFRFEAVGWKVHAR